MWIVSVLAPKITYYIAKFIEDEYTSAIVPVGLTVIGVTVNVSSIYEILIN